LLHTEHCFDVAISIDKAKQSVVCGNKLENRTDLDMNLLN
jgi:hypothetical protein